MASGSNVVTSHMANKLTPGRVITIDLTKETTPNFDGSTNITVGVQNTLPISHGGTGSTSYTEDRLLYTKTESNVMKFKSADSLTVLNNYELATRNSTNIYANGLLIRGACYGATASDMASNTAGIFRFQDGGPQIMFSSGDPFNQSNPGQCGTLIFTTHNAGGGAASFHFVTSESSDDTGGNLIVTAPRFRARAGLTIGQNTDNTSYKLYVNGNSYFNGDNTLNGDNIFSGSGKSSTFSHEAIFESTIRIKNNESPRIYFTSKNTANLLGGVFCISDTTNDTLHPYRMLFRLYSYNSITGAGITDYWNNFYLEATPNLSSKPTYKILSEKETITVAQGGTGQTTIANIQAGKDGDGNTISSTYLKLSGGTVTGDVTFNGLLAGKLTGTFSSTGSSNFKHASADITKSDNNVSSNDNRHLYFYDATIAYVIS